MYKFDAIFVRASEDELFNDFAWMFWLVFPERKNPRENLHSVQKILRLSGLMIFNFLLVRGSHLVSHESVQDNQQLLLKCFVIAMSHRNGRGGEDCISVPMEVAGCFIRSLYSGMSTRWRDDIRSRLDAMDVEDQFLLGTAYRIGGPEEFPFMVLNEGRSREVSALERRESRVSRPGSDFTARADVGVRLIEQMYRSMPVAQRADVKLIVREVDAQEPVRDAFSLESRPTVVDLPNIDRRRCGRQCVRCHIPSCIFEHGHHVVSPAYCYCQGCFDHVSRHR